MMLMFQAFCRWYYLPPRLRILRKYAKSTQHSKQINYNFTFVLRQACGSLDIAARVAKHSVTYFRYFLIRLKNWIPFEDATIRVACFLILSRHSLKLDYRNAVKFVHTFAKTSMWTIYCEAQDYDVYSVTASRWNFMGNSFHGWRILFIVALHCCNLYDKIVSCLTIVG